MKAQCICQCRPELPWYWLVLATVDLLTHQPHPYAFFIFTYSTLQSDCMLIFTLLHASWAASWLLLNMSFSHDFFLGLCSSPPICIACLSSLLSKLFRILPLRVSFHLQLQNGIFCVFSWLSWWVRIEQLAYLCKHTRCPQPGLAAAIPGAVESTPVSLTAWGLPRCAQGRGGAMQWGRETWGFRLVHFPGIFWGR